MTELEILQKKYEIALQGLQDLANQPRLLSYGVMNDKAQGIDQERRETVIKVRAVLKKIEEMK